MHATQLSSREYGTNGGSAAGGELTPGRRGQKGFLLDLLVNGANMEHLIPWLFELLSFWAMQRGHCIDKGFRNG